MVGSPSAPGGRPGSAREVRPGLLLVTRRLRARSPEAVEVPLAQLPRLSRRAIALALRLNPRFLDSADLNDPIWVAGRGRVQLVLDGRHRLSKATWTGRASLYVVRVPLWYAIELLTPGVYEVEWLLLRAARALRGRTTPTAEPATTPRRATGFGPAASPSVADRI